MRVYRLEFEDNHDKGPFNPPLDARTNLSLMVYGTRPTMIPADAAQAVAAAQDKPGPYDMPAITNDGITKFDMEAFANRIGLYDTQGLVFGFASIEQYKEWFTTRMQRRVLFKKVGTLDKETGPNGLELRCFEVPDHRVLKAEHQVMFALDDAVTSKKVPMKEAIG